MPVVQNKTGQIPEFFYAGKKKESRDAEKLLNDQGIHVLVFRVNDTDQDTRDDPRPPCLITGDGRFSGLASIKQYLAHHQRSRNSRS